MGRLSDLLNIEFALAVGIMELLWHYTARYAPRGDIGKWSNDDIARNVRWRGNPDELVAGLVKAGWLDEDPEYRLIIHDWHVHSDQACDRYLARHGLDYAKGTPARRGGKNGDNDGTLPDNNGKSPQKSANGGTNPDKTSHDGTCLDMSSHDGTCLVKAVHVPDTHTHNHSHTHSQSEEGDRATEGDEAFRILKARPELSRLTWEQDLMARKDWGAFPETIDWELVAGKVADLAVLAGPIEQPGSWLRKQYDKVIRQVYVKNQKNGAAPNSPKAYKGIEGNGNGKL